MCLTPQHGIDAQQRREELGGDAGLGLSEPFPHPPVFPSPSHVFIVALHMVSAEGVWIFINALRVKMCPLLPFNRAQV